MNQEANPYSPVIPDQENTGTSSVAWPWPWLLLGLGVIPFAIVVVTALHEGVHGDPPNSLSEFKAYHYWSGAAVALCFAWFACIFFAFRRRYRWILLLSGGLCLWVCWVAFSLLREINAHPAGEYYRSLW